ncbi:MAG TPA: hypothetical protein VE890_06620, partial [Thermoguttaceae bacterium]|nr:hypothetical protein [Thermoguttaceae bacterium]
HAAASAILARTAFETSMTKRTKESSWAQSRERGAYLGIRFMFAVYRLVGRTAFRIALIPVIFYFFLFSRVAQRSSLAFLSQVHACGGGPWPQNEPPGWRQSFRHFMTFGEAALDKVAAWSGAFKDIPVKYDGRKLLESWQDAGRGAVFLTSHLGNIEACRALARERTDLKLNVLVHTRHAENFNRMLRGVDADVRVRLVEVTDFGPATAMDLQTRVDAGEFVVIAADRIPVSGGRTKHVRFLGRETILPIGGPMLAAVLRCPVGMITAVREGDGFHMFIDQLGNFQDIPRSKRNREISRIIYLFSERLGQLACRYPYQWFNFFDFWRSSDQQRQAEALAPMDSSNAVDNCHFPNRTTRLLER